MLAFERLDAWKVCHQLVLAVYRVVKSLPDAQQGDAVVWDLTRAALLPAAKIARGSGLHDRKLCQHCVDRAIGHLSELAYHLQMARELGVLPKDKYQELDALRGRAVFYTVRLLFSLDPSPDTEQAGEG